MTTTAVSTTRTLNVAGIGPVELTVEERGDGRPFLVLHGGAGPQSVAALLDAVGIEVEDHPIADVSGLSVPEIQALSFHDPTPFRVDLATIPDAQKAIMAANGAALAAYAGSPAMADPTLLGRLDGIAIPTLVLWGESDQIARPAYGQAYAAAISQARFEVLPATGHMPQMEAPDLVLREI